MIRDRLTGAVIIRGLSRMIAVAGAVVAVGILPWLGGQSAEYTVLRARYADLEVTPEALARVRAELGLDQGPWVLLGRWLAGLVRGDLGTSWISGRPLGPGLMQALGVSLTLVAASVVVAAITVVVVCLPAMRAGLEFRTRRGSGVVATALASIPSFLLAAVLLVVVSVWWGWLPPYGWSSPAHVVLPALSMGLPAGAYLGRLLGDAIAGAWSEDWVRTWSVSGASDARLCVAVLRRALVGLVSQIALTLVGLLAGAVAVEQIFAIPGLGRSLLGSAAAQDIPATQAAIVLLLGVAVGLGMVANLVRRIMLGPAAHDQVAPVSHPVRAGRSATVVATVAATGLGLLVLLGWGRDPYAVAHDRLEQPGWSLLLGADASGRDVLARVAHGALTTLGTATVVVAITLVVGLLIGLTGSWGTGLVEVANAVPSLIVGLMVTAVLGPSIEGAALAVCLTAWAPLAAHTSDLLTEVSARPYVRLQPIWGVGPVRILLATVLPVVIPAVTRHAVLRLPGRALELAALSFLGLGSRPPSPDWGLLLAEGIDYVERAPWAVLGPTVALILASVSAVAVAARAR